ncbi:MAG: thioredoxin domain-containing protein [Gemmatimonadota bacterium]
MNRPVFVWLALASLLSVGGGVMLLGRAAPAGAALVPAPQPAAVPVESKTDSGSMEVPASLRRQLDPLIGQRTKGSPSAPVTVYEMSDFQCPFCRRQAVETFPIIDRDYIATGKVRWIFLQFPLTQIHANAAAAAEFSMCAAALDKFWPIHDLLFTYQEKWAPLKDPGPFLITLADSVGIPRSDMTSCLTNHETRDRVQAEAEGAAKSGVSSTPTVYIEGAGMLRGAAPIATYRSILDSLVKERTAKKQ